MSIEHKLYTIFKMNLRLAMIDNRMLYIIYEASAPHIIFSENTTQYEAIDFLKSYPYSNILLNSVMEYYQCSELEAYEHMKEAWRAQC